MSLRQLSIQWKITLLAGLCLAGIVTLLVGLSLYRMEHSSEMVKASSMEMLTEAAQARIESQGENQALVIRQQFMDAYQYGHGFSRQVLFLNYSAVDPVLTNEKCSYWHFRFDAHADMRMTALMNVLREDKDLKNIYLIGQDYSFGQSVLREARSQLAAKRPDVKIVGDELHPMARVKDFAPYAAKIKASGAQAVLTGNWGNDLTLLVKAAREAGFEGSFYTFYGNALGAPAAIGDAGIGRVIAVADWFPNVPTKDSEAFYQSFRQRFPNPADDYVHMRMQLISSRWRRPSNARARSTPPPSRRNWKRSRSNSPARPHACAPQTTSSSSRWPWR